MSEKEPEQILREVFDVLAQFEKVNVKVERPIPIVRDRQGRLAKDLTLRKWLLKGQEEMMKLQDAVSGVCLLDEKPSNFADCDRKEILEEACDVIEWVFSFMNQLGYTPETIDYGIHNTNKKLKERGCI